MKKIVVLLLLIVSLLAVSCDAEFIMKAAGMITELKRYTLSDYGPKQVNVFSEKIESVFEGQQDENSIISSEELGPLVDSILELSESVVGADAVRDILSQKWKDKSAEEDEMIDFVSLSLDIINTSVDEESDPEVLKEKVTTLIESVLGLDIDFFVRIANGPAYESATEDMKEEMMDKACQQVQITLKAINSASSVINSFQSMFQDFADRDYKSFGDHIAASIMGDIVTEVALVFAESNSSDSSPNYLDSLVSGGSGDRILKDIQALEIIYGSNVGLDKLVLQMVDKKN